MEILSQMVNEEPKEWTEFYNDMRMLLIKYYGTCIGKGGDAPVSENDVLEAFNVYFEVEDEAKKVLADFRKKMDDARENGISQEDMADLLDETIDAMDQFNENMG